MDATIAVLYPRRQYDAMPPRYASWQTQSRLRNTEAGWDRRLTDWMYQRELATLGVLDVTCGQGYLLGRPSTLPEQWKEWHVAGSQPSARTA